MLRRFLTAAAASAIALTAVAPVAAQAEHWHDGYGGYERGDHWRGGYGGYDRGYYRGGGRYWDHGRYHGRGYYRGHCRDSGTGGTILGAIAGGLLGNSIAGYGDRTAGTIIGAGVGALAGRAIDRDC